MKKTFQLKDIDPIIFSGVGDENIKIIENYFNSKIVLRGNSLIVDGLKKEINEIILPRRSGHPFLQHLLPTHVHTSPGGLLLF